MTVAEERLARIEAVDLAGLGRADIDDVIEYVHVPTARLPEWLSLYDRYLRQRWNVNELDFSAGRRRLERPDDRRLTQLVPVHRVRLPSR